MYTYIYIRIYIYIFINKYHYHTVSAFMKICKGLLLSWKHVEGLGREFSSPESGRV